MSFTQADLDAINAKIASGVQRLRFQDRQVDYQPLADLLRAKADIEAEVSKSSGSPIVRQIRPIVGRGW